jgi:hypothetical protein
MENEITNQLHLFVQKLSSQVLLPFPASFLHASVWNLEAFVGKSARCTTNLKSVSAPKFCDHVTKLAESIDSIAYLLTPRLSKILRGISLLDVLERACKFLLKDGCFRSRCAMN